jgi:hypothetical protein
MANLKEPKVDMEIAARKVMLAFAPIVLSLGIAVSASAVDHPLDYRILATSRTSTMEKELNEAGAAGYRFSKATGGESANGGKEVVVAMSKESTASDNGVRKYRLLATAKTSTMQKELQQAADEGYEYRAQAVFETAFGGQEVVVIMELDTSRNPRSSYRLLATSRTSTMQKELNELGQQGYALVGLTIGKTAFGGDEVVAILQKD